MHLFKKYQALVLLLIISLITLASCSRKTLGGAVQKNDNSVLDKPYVILISLDGFRWDYVDRFSPPQLVNFIEKGVKAESLIPTFPSKTFPNHYSIATGMYPDKHGLLGNLYYHYDKEEVYAVGNREVVEDGTFYKGIPIWVQADKAGMVTASYFFVGTEADIQGMHPSYYFKYDGKTTNEERVSQALKWLQLPEKKRPHLITMYFSDMDDAGHEYGPEDEENITRALLKLDEDLGYLFRGIENSGLPVNVILVSDHGMFTATVDNLLPLEMVQDTSRYRAISNGAIVSIHPKGKNSVDEIYEQLKAQESGYKVYRTQQAPHFEYVPRNENWGPLQVIPDPGFYFSSQRAIEKRKQSSQKVFGLHGFDPKLKDMHGIFYANGPAFKSGYSIPPIRNIHIYPLICKILGIEVPADIDGDLSATEKVLN
ncbi:ectonucleotide pyrophosphatase/phosphodiesterase [Zeaxanthinibacter sp. PT1]|uniref:alkaline phosphatase family protein n=1 Tax=Zeaxanthinibacter TaxID=561554 RepID=UPI00234904B1|nr:ectonucleotide pyrophosphatase/phosphodiesterase [Zeaxanthinibacter sp. PT1]MDC6350961.1 ectonucleotide pyrophosphatase/phosphodiesterase [Zeaxanthinibacter sp. PT1]